MITSTSTIPALEELKLGKQWVCFNEEKKPISSVTLKGVSGELVEGNADWADYKTAVAAWEANNRWIKGVGREFVKADRITGIDLDDCIDAQGNIAPWAQDVLDLINSYAEYSPSRRGIHLWTHASIPNAIAPGKPAHDGFEMYDSGRYFTITGKHVPGTPTTIEDRQEQVAQLHREITARRQAAKTPPPRQQRARAAPSHSHEARYAEVALEKIAREVASTSEGSRNQALNDAALKMGHMIASGWISRAAVERELSWAARDAGLTRGVMATINSGISRGIKEPHAPLKEQERDYERYRPASPGSSNGNGNGHHSPTETTFDLCEFDADDAGNSDAMNALYGDDFLYCASLGWLYYNTNHWSIDSDGAQVKRCAIETLRQRRHAAVDAKNETIIKCTKADERRVNGCVNLFKTHVSTGIDAFDNSPDMLNCKNGVLDLRTGILGAHSRKQRFTYCIPVEYDKADYSLWIDYMNGVIGGGQEVIDYLQMAAGYSLTGHTREEILFYLFGPSRSGKGTWAETFMALLPTPISKMVDFNSFTAKREGDVSNFDLAPLKPSRLIFASESNRSQSLNPAKIKQLTGGDHISACFKHKDFFDYRPQFKVWMMSNHPVNGDPEDDALWGRVRVIEFPNSFLGKEDKTKKARLKEPEALKGVLYWAVQGAIKWYALGASGLVTPKAIAQTTQAQRAELDYVQQWLDECSDDDEGGWTANEEVTTSYTEWCKNNNVEYKKGPKALAQSLKAKGYAVGEVRKIDKKSKRGVGGLHIYPVAEPKKEAK